MRRFATGPTSQIITDQPIGGINTTPLIDVLLVLLVMFIITIPIQMHKIPVELPQAAPMPASQQMVHLLAITKSGAVMLDGAAVDSSALAARLGNFKTDLRNELQVKTDPEARYENFAKTLAVVKRAGITRLGFVGNSEMTK